MYYYKMCEITAKLPFLKKGTKKLQVYAPKEALQKRTLAQNCFNLTIQNVTITTKLFLYKKRQKIYLSYKSSDIKKLRQL